MFAVKATIAGGQFYRSFHGFANGSGNPQQHVTQVFGRWIFGIIDDIANFRADQRKAFRQVFRKFLKSGVLFVLFNRGQVLLMLFPGVFGVVRLHLFKIGQCLAFFFQQGRKVGGIVLRPLAVKFVQLPIAPGINRRMHGLYFGVAFSKQGVVLIFQIVIFIFQV